MQSRLERLNGIDVPRSIGFNEEGNTLVITLQENCVNANMQEDRAAFEAWALVAKANGYTQVRLEKEKEISINSKAHYNRFIYRAFCFNELFDWFLLSNDILEEVEEFCKKYLESNKLVYNVPHNVRN